MKKSAETGTRAMLVLAATVLSTAAIANPAPPSGLAKSPYKPAQGKVVPPEGGIASASYTYKHDDGTSEASYGNTQNGVVVWGNRFDTLASATTISAIQVAFGTVTTPGSAVKVYLLSDPNQDGNPDDSVVLSVVNGITANENTVTFNTYTLTAPVVVSGKFFVAASLVTPCTTCFPTQLDTGTTKARSWWRSGFSDINNPFSGPGTSSPSEFGDLVVGGGNWLLRAVASGDPCADPLKRCAADIAPTVAGNGQVNIDDLLAVINSWGLVGDPAPHPIGDVAPGANGNCVVNIDDLLKVINSWGPCAPPANDNCANAITISNGTTQYDNVNANTDGPNGSACEADITRDIWYTYTTDCAGTLTVRTEDGPNATGMTDTVLAVYSGSGCPAGTLVACDDESGDGSLSKISFQVNPGETYKIRVGNWQNTTQGAGAISVQCKAFNTDICSDAEPMAIGASLSRTVVGATAESPANPSCVLADNGIGRWYSVIGDGNTLTASTCNTVAGQNWDAILSVFCGPQESPCSDLHCISAANDDIDCNGGNNAVHESVSWCSKANQKYFIFVARPTAAAPGAGQGLFTLTVTTDGASCAFNPAACGLPAPDNDEKANAKVLTNAGLIGEQMAGATDSGDAGLDCTGGGATFAGRDVWYKYTATGSAVKIDLCATPFDAFHVDDTILEIYDGTTVLGCDEDSCSTANSFASTLTVSNLTPGNLYYVRIALYDGSTEGMVDIAVTPGGTCGNSVIEIGEQCDGGAFCTGCQLVDLKALPDASCVLETEVCLVDGNCDSTNGTGAGAVPPASENPCPGCNFSPNVTVGVPHRGKLSTYITGLNYRDADHWNFTPPSNGHYRLYINANFAGAANFMVAQAATPCTTAIAFIEPTTNWGTTFDTNFGVPVFGAGLTAGTNYPIRIRPNATTGIACGAATYTFIVIKID